MKKLVYDTIQVLTAGIGRDEARKVLIDYLNCNLDTLDAETQNQLVAQIEKLK